MSMTHEEAARILDPETSAKALREYGDGNEQIAACDEACRIAADVLRNKPTREPLTLEQLRRMDGQPVRMEDLTGGTLWNQWIIFERHTDDGFIPRGGGYFGCDSYGVKWLAYAHSIAHIDREAWVSVEERLPEPNSGPYWVAKKKSSGEWQMRMALFCDYGYAMPVDAKTDVTWRDWDYTKIVNVSHWMLLPKPPAELEKRLRG